MAGEFRSIRLINRATQQVAERIFLGLDVERLQNELKGNVFPLKPVFPAPHYGGWSITSATGSYQDGWEYASPRLYAKTSNGFMFDREKQNAPGLPGLHDPKALPTVPTELCTGYIKSVVERISILGFMPVRVRISALKAQSELPWHQDTPVDIYSVRLHIPILTNPFCFFETKDGAFHMPADGNGYLVKINQPHRAVNQGENDRYHLMMGVWDTRGISKFHRYTQR